MASAMFLARGVDHCREDVEAHWTEVRGSHRCRLLERGRELAKSLTPILAVLLMSDFPHGERNL